MGSTSPFIGNTTRRLKLFHTSLVFRQEVSGGAKYWTLEFDMGETLGVMDIVDIVVPKIIGGKFAWVADARWCLREGLYNGRAHWSKSFVDVANISSSQFEHVMLDFVPQFNSSVPGAWPQYQFF